MCSLGAIIAWEISCTLVKLRVKNIQRFKQAVSQSKMDAVGFHCIAKLRAQICYPLLADCEVYSADCHSENGRTSDCKSQEPEFASGLPQA
jgi:hypothetical protein